ncbi:MAG: tubulin/FtsZ family protein [Chloroflexota bacterium]
MKLIVIGCGQCGGRIADEFARLNIKASIQRGIRITNGIYAVNTDVTDLTQLSSVKRDHQHRILIGNQKTGGHGVGKINEMAAEIAAEESDKIIDALRTADAIAETDAFLLIASASGGTGSGVIPILTQKIKERYRDKPVYNLIALPFAHEETTEARTVYNTAVCLKSAYLVADAVFLVDNQRFVSDKFSLDANLRQINKAVVEPFYNLLCAGEEKKPQYIGSKVLDAGDIMQTLSGWTILGQGMTRVHGLGFNLFGRSSGSTDFRDKRTEAGRGIQSMQTALTELSLKCNPADARRALYLVTAPHGEMSIDMLKNLGGMLKNMATDAIIRTGDYPRENNFIAVAVVLSELTNVSKVVSYFTKALTYIYANIRKQEGIAQNQRSIEDSFKDIPSLLRWM